MRVWAARLALAAAIAGGVSYLTADHLTLTPAVSLAWKGTGVGLLALYAALSARSLDGWLVCGVMALGAAGDVLLGAAGFAVGGAAFFAGHMAAIMLYQRNRREGLGWPAWLAAAALIAGTIGAAITLPSDRSAAPALGIYAAGLSYMAASAWLSRFPRSVPLGATMFLASDLLIFARSGPLPASAVVGFAVWGLYFVGQALIATGVVRTLARDAH
ncbi:MAG: lysoplasmalogenase [Phenylobacterium sp.]|nr:MAG: lysoplasmalogenase [Phenylobacterium sp.]